MKSTNSFIGVNCKKLKCFFVYYVYHTHTQHTRANGASADYANGTGGDAGGDGGDGGADCLPQKAERGTQGAEPVSQAD